MTDNESHLIPPYSCASCERRWSGVSRCHCGVNITADVGFLAVDAKRAKVMDGRYKTLYPIGDAWHLLAELVHDPLAEPVRRGRFAGTDDILTDSAELTTGGFTQIHWGAIGLALPTAAVMLDAPSHNDRAKVVALQIDGTVFYLRSSLPRTRGDQGPQDPGALLNVRLRAGCHRTFTGEGAFSLHHAGGHGCQDPATLVRKEGVNAGTRLLFLNNGLWGSEEHPADPGAALRALRQRKSADLIDA